MIRKLPTRRASGSTVRHPGRRRAIGQAGRAACAVAALALGALSARAQSVPGDFETTFRSLAGMVDAVEVGAMQMAKGTYDATRFYAVGAAGLEPNVGWYVGAPSFGQAAVAGLYLAVWGRASDLATVRRELETNGRKRAWLQQMLGDEARFFASIDSGRTWAGMVALLPAIGGTRTLMQLLMGSRDPLVRRAGLFWGYFLADAAYWSRVRALRQADPDALNRRVADRLLRGQSG